MNLAISEQTLRAIDWQNQELDKQTNVIQQAGFQFNETASRIGENTSKINETLREAGEETQDIAPLRYDMGSQTNPQLKLELVDLTTRR